MATIHPHHAGTTHEERERALDKAFAALGESSLHGVAYRYCRSIYDESSPVPPRRLPGRYYLFHHVDGYVGTLRRRSGAFDVAVLFSYINWRLGASPDPSSGTTPAVRYLLDHVLTTYELNALMEMTRLVGSNEDAAETH